MNDHPILIPLSLLDEHPANPRVIWRQDVIDSIAAQIRAAGGYDPRHAITVRPANDRYQIISGHHRSRAASAAGLTEIPAWVRDMTDEEALLELDLSNTQSELSPLERGIHALACIEKGKHGAGVAAYAARTGRQAATVDKEVRAARVAKACDPALMPSLLARARHLAEIYTLDPECWSAMVARLVAEEWTVRETHQHVAAIQALEQPEDFPYLFPVETMRQRAAADATFTAARVAEIVRAVHAARSDIAFLQYRTPEALAELDAWLRENVGGAAWDPAAIHERALAICDQISREKRDRERRAMALTGASLESVARAAAMMCRFITEQRAPDEAEYPVIEDAATALREAGYL